MKHHIIDSLPKLNEYASDDEIEMNTQTGSHWDSLKHVRIPYNDRRQGDMFADRADYRQYAWQSRQVFYNGLTYEDAKASNKNGIHSEYSRHS